MSVRQQAIPQRQWLKVTHQDADIKRFGNPIGWYTSFIRFEPIDISRSRTSVVVHVAGKSGVMLKLLHMISTCLVRLSWYRTQEYTYFRITDQEDTFDSFESIACEARKRIIGCSGALGISFEDEAFIWITGQCGLNMIDNLIERTLLDLLLDDLNIGEIHTSRVPDAEF
jgi:hypothetical protein